MNNTINQTIVCKYAYLALNFDVITFIYNKNNTGPSTNPCCDALVGSR